MPGTSCWCLAPFSKKAEKIGIFVFYKLRIIVIMDSIYFEKIQVRGGSAMGITEKLDELLDLARDNAELKERLLDTQKSVNPVADFCAIASDNGLSMSVMDIVNQGEEFYAEIKRSTNGGGENSPDLDFQNDEYSIFMMRLRDL